MDDRHQEKKDQVTAEFSRQIAAKEQRKLKGRRQKGQDVWFGLGDVRPGRLVGDHSHPSWHRAWCLGG